MERQEKIWLGVLIVILILFNAVTRFATGTLAKMAHLVPARTG